MWKGFLGSSSPGQMAGLDTTVRLKGTATITQPCRIFMTEKANVPAGIPANCCTAVTCRRVQEKNVPRQDGGQHS